MREHRYKLEMPHSAARIWALMQDYPRWTEYAPMVLARRGDPPRRRAGQRPPAPRDLPHAVRAARQRARAGDRDVEPARGYTYTMLSREPGNDQTGRVRLEPLGPGARASTSRSATT